MSSRIVIIGGGPAGYEAALVAARLGAEVTLVERDGLGGACVLYDCVPSKTFIASSDAANAFRHGDSVGVMACEPEDVKVNAAAVHGRVKGLALAQSADIRSTVAAAGVEVVTGFARLDGRVELRHVVTIEPSGGTPYQVEADNVLLATGATPRIIPGAEPDGERILTWRDVYDLPELPTHLVVVGSGVTGAEFASAYLAMGVQVTLVSSRDRVMPHEDSDAANLIEQVFARRGMTILYKARADRVERTADGIVVRLTDGRTVEGSHALMTIGSVPNTSDLGLKESNVETGGGGFVTVDRVSRTNVPGIYAAGDVTGVLMLASVAAAQGRIAMAHALGEAVQPLRLRTVAANVFTDPEISTVGFGQTTMEAGEVPARTVTLPLGTNPRAKMQGLTDGFVKLFCRPASGLVIGGVVVAPRASELILPVAMAVQNHLTVDQIAQTISIYPSLSGSLTEAARQLMQHEFE
ncbi:NAD(P)H-quinone dehydrogenase [Cryptosporangium japonicum]|uniref:NAD(P)H-quinone dehydrogenase n=1 Tax=Cryptosporangium japonicum TaxID=80872 RepID=A0ABP3DFQ9_9ACTN